MAFNKFVGLGNLTRDVQLKNVGAQNTALAEFGIAMNEKYKDKETVCFIDVKAWGKQAEVIQKYFKKGDPILIEGKVAFETWEDKKDGSKRSKHTITLEKFSFVGGKKDGGNGGGGGGGGRSQQPFGDEEQFKDDDIPF